MKIRHSELDIDEKEPFSKCRLDRRKYAEILTNIVSTYSDGFVLAINNEWGAGKTTFVRMWQQELSNQGIKTIYFNAWENDFDTNPLTAILAELESITNRSNKAAFKSAMQKGAVLTKHVLPGVVKAATKRYFDTQEVVDAIENATKGSTELLQTGIDEYLKKKKSIKEFKEKLEIFTKKTDGEKPIVFIIDELDRCRPDYAVEVLEQLKHFFSVPGITFVLSIDKKHLAAAVCGFYGSDRINTDEYLRRFIDLEYSIPEPSVEQFCNYLYEYYGFDQFFASPDRQQHDAFRNDRTTFLRTASLIGKEFNSTLRQVEKFFGLTRLILGSFKPNQYTFPDLLFVLVVLATMKPANYYKLKIGELSLQDVSNEFAELFLRSEQKARNSLILTQARLLVLYKNEFDPYGEKLLKTDETGVRVTDINSKLESDSSESLASALQHAIYYHPAHATLKFLTNRIDLTEPLVSFDSEI